MEQQPRPDCRLLHRARSSQRSKQPPPTSKPICDPHDLALLIPPTSIDMAHKQHFSVPILPLENHPGGAVVCTEPQPQLYLLTFSSPPDNRLTHHFIDAMLTALDIIEGRFSPGVVVTTSAVTKFYSNGLDLGLVGVMDGFFEKYLYKLLARFLSYPMPTVALINGHAFAGGMMLAMHHDYRVFSGAKGFLCVNEIDFGAPLPIALANIYQAKLHPSVVREIVLEGRRWTAEGAVEARVIDSAEGWNGVQKLVDERSLVKKAESGVYRVLKQVLYRDQLALLTAAGNATGLAGDWMTAEAERRVSIQAKAAKL